MLRWSMQRTGTLGEPCFNFRVVDDFAPGPSHIATSAELIDPFGNVADTFGVLFTMIKVPCIK